MRTAEQMIEDLQAQRAVSAHAHNNSHIAVIACYRYGIDRCGPGMHWAYMY